MISKYRYFNIILVVDANSVWLNLCKNKDFAKDRYRAFLKAYIKYSIY
jgi:hypothetical protein